MFLIKKHLNNIEEYMCAILLSGFVILMFAQIVSRQILTYSIAWGDEVATYSSQPRLLAVVLVATLATNSTVLPLPSPGLRR